MNRLSGISSGSANLRFVGERGVFSRSPVSIALRQWAEADLVRTTFPLIFWVKTFNVGNEPRRKYVSETEILTVEIVPSGQCYQFHSMSELLTEHFVEYG